MDVSVNPPNPPFKIAQSPFEPFAQNDMQMVKPVTVAARNPARDFRGANFIAGIKGK
jgi:hypothetical protein